MVKAYVVQDCVCTYDISCNVVCIVQIKQPKNLNLNIN